MRRLRRQEFAPRECTRYTEGSPVPTEANAARTIKVNRPCTDCEAETVAMADWKQRKPWYLQESLQMLRLNTLGFV